MRRLVTIEQLSQVTNDDQGRRFLRRIQDRMSDMRPASCLTAPG